MVFRDAIFSQMTADDFNAAVRPKAHGSWNLHKQVKGVDFFIMLSLLVGVMGGAGQANYAAAQAIITTSLPLPQNSYYIDSFARSLLAAIVTGINRSAGVHWNDATWMQENRFLGLRHWETFNVGQGRVPSSGLPLSSSDVWVRVSELSSRDEAVGIILQEITRKLLKILGTAEDDMSSSKSLASVGVDSLMAIKLQNWITTQLQVDISVFKLMGGQTKADLAALVLNKHN